ncbi:MAG: mannose-1-phosphate guanylyltransferase/mannose-6-phosphate isomerase [Rhodospirillaceae bacterium TMED8]|nr:mannose-1-phosphate guanylyltransferase/mannose-6-phosphate isomerase [Magnetovibrio sp.]OUT47937.1 MAG: mannose-1-phosphate guanylyltransferase/mannose-6-phosphate isomerase [Rhodospirillaceae bacterium TMED8]
MKSKIITPVVLSGGVGSRLWPLSRSKRPKQFIPLTGSMTMFAKTLLRVTGEPFGPPMIVCNEEHRFLVAEELRALALTAHDIILEPCARNTAPALSAAALRLLAHDQDALMLVVPSDHMLSDTDAFHNIVKNACALAKNGHLVAFGVEPDRPETGYGYIRRGVILNNTGWQVEKFVEKPALHKVERYLSEGAYLWNAGIFLFSAKALIDELKYYYPEIVASTLDALHQGSSDLNFFRLGKSAFESSPAISIDFAVMEKTHRAAVVLLNTEWSDVGSWERLWALSKSDKNGNVSSGRTIMVETNDTYVRTEKPLVATIGVKGLTVVATDDAVLVMPTERAQDVKLLVADLEASKSEEVNSHTCVYRPWGYYQNLEAGDGFLVKRIVVSANAKLSLQYHLHRAEHWIVVAGIARVTNGDELYDLKPNQSTYIPSGVAHRLENPGSTPLQLIEVQSGKHISENDIVRLEDTYGRK